MLQLQTPGTVIMSNSGTCLAAYCAEGLYRKLARARVEQVVLEPRRVQPSDHS